MTARRRVPPLRQCIDCRSQVRSWSRHCRCADCSRALRGAVQPHVQPVRNNQTNEIPF